MPQKERYSSCKYGTVIAPNDEVWPWAGVNGGSRSGSVSVIVSGIECLPEVPRMVHLPHFVVVNPSVE
jgi:hypothetical protein